MEFETTALLYPSKVDELVRLIKHDVPSADISIEAGGEVAENWWIDIRTGVESITLEWHPHHGYRIYDPVSGGYGDGPSEIFQKPELAARRIIQLLRAESPQLAGSWLKQLRELHGFSQVALAEKLGVNQAAVSKMENRSELLLGSLAAVTKALGGNLEITAHFQDCKVCLRPEQKEITR